MKEYLDSLSPGEKVETPEYSVRKNGPDNFDITSHRTGNRMAGDTIMVMSVFSTGSTSSILSVNGVGSFGSLMSVSYPILTVEERTELDGLEQDHKSFIKVNRIKKFQNLPKHLRQEIVDEAYIRDLSISLAAEDDKDFPDLDRLQKLRNKNWGNSYGVTTISMGSYNNNEVHIVGKYSNILNHFKTEELAKAHAEACIEEEIQ